MQPRRTPFWGGIDGWSPASSMVPNHVEALADPESIGGSSSSLCAWPKRIHLGAMIASSGRWPISGTRSQIRPSRITNVYNKTIINNTTINKVSFNGATGGTTARPTAEEQAAAHDKHVPATDLQSKHQQAANSNRASFASVNKGHPGVAATATAGLLAGAGVVAAKGAKAVPGPLNAAKVSSGQAVIKQGTAAKLTDPAGPRRFGNLPPGGVGQRYSTTPKGFGPQSGNYPPGAAGQRYTTRQATTPKGFGPQSGNLPPGAAGQRYTRQLMTPKGIGPQSPPRQGVSQARRPDQRGNAKRPDNR
jgi:hypothetical protein